MVGREPWSSGYGKRLKFQRSWVRFPALYTGWTFLTFICCKNCKVCLKRPKINEKEAGVGPFKKHIRMVTLGEKSRGKVQSSESTFEERSRAHSKGAVQKNTKIFIFHMCVTKL